MEHTDMSVVFSQSLHPSPLSSLPNIIQPIYRFTTVITVKYILEVVATLILRSAAENRPASSN
jgi:hypothetical protein